MPNPFFEVCGKLGEGGQGQVLKVRDSRLEREVAVKELKAELARDRDEVRRFVVEAKTTAQLQHPGIPAVYELGQNQDGTPFMALRLVEGETLTSIIERLQDNDPATHRNFPFPRRLQLVVRLCETLEYAHHHGWLHRDIKPDNIMVGLFGEVYLMDWGLARRTPHVDTRPRDPGVFTGTPAFASPEALQGQTLTPCSEVYSLGAVLYALLALRLPHDAEDVHELIRQVLEDKPVAPETLFISAQGRVPREVNLIVLKALEKAPENRYPDVAALREDLVRVLENEARPVCPHTAMKSIFFKLNRFLDNYPLAALLIYLWLALPILLTGAWAFWG